MGAMPELSGALLLASISDAMRASSHAQASTSQCAAATHRFAHGCADARAALPLTWAARPDANMGDILLDDVRFRVAPRRQQHLPRQVQHLLNLPHPDEAVQAFHAFRNHVLARLNVLVRARHAIVAQLDRTSHWRPFRRHRAASSEDQSRSTAGMARGSRLAQRWLEEGAACERDLKMEEAVRCYERAVEADPASAESLARLSKVLSDSSYVPGTPSERAVELNKKAIEMGSRAIAVDPRSAYGFVACCVSRGRLALHMDNRTKVALARQAQDDVKTALQLEPDNDVAHHLLGRWNYEMAGLNAFVRTLIQMLYGTALMAGSYKEAALCYEAAVRLRPNYLIHRVELGRTYSKLGRQPDALRQLEAAMELDVPDINALLQKEDAVLLLAKLKGSNGR